jgi:Gpi18-like mannosyltransferase
MLLASLYLILKEKPASALAAFGLSFAVKAQAVFFAPFLAILFLQKRIRWKYALAVAAAYLLAVLPVVALGRPLMETLLIYVNQANMVEKLSANAPNLYYLFPYDVYERVLPFGLVTAIVLIPLWIFSSAKNAKLFDAQKLVFYAFISTALTPFLLPKMHDRYFYPADVFSIALAFHDPRFWFLPIIYQVVSTASISVFLFNVNTDAVVFAAIANSLTIAYILREQWKLEGWKTPGPAANFFFSWLTAALVPFLILGISAKLALTPLYFRIEYNVQEMLNELQPLSKYDLIVKSSNAIKYLTGDKEIRFLTRLRLSNGENMFAEEEYFRLQNAKKELREAYFYWLTCALTLYAAGLFAWSKNWLALFQRGVKKGAQIAIGAGLLFLPAALFALAKTPTLFLFQLFSIRVWQGAAAAVSALTIVVGSLFIFLTEPAQKEASACAPR